jgi:predicted ribosome quality control (RQC) complex YloA/Tae2 family protein
MYFDALTMAAVAHELRDSVLGGRVQKVLQPDDLSIGLEVYAHRERRYLLASAHPQHCRVHLTQTKLRRGVETPAPLLLLLRKYARGGRISAIEQPPWERVLKLEMDHPLGMSTLIVEVMGRHSNIILVDATGEVMDAIKRVTPEMTRVRVVLPHRLYTPPPPLAKLALSDLTEGRLRQILATFQDAPLWRALLGGLKGLSPLLAREIAYRAQGDAEAPVSSVDKFSPLLQVIEEFNGLMHVGGWRPSVVKEKSAILAFAPYPLAQYGEYEKVASVSAAVEAYYTQAVGNPYEAARKPLRQAIAEARERLRRRQGSLERALVPESEVQRLRVSGEMILAYAAEIKEGQRELVVPDVGDGSTVRIPLDPQLSPVENAQRTFKEYRKAKGAAEEVPALLAQAALEAQYLDQLETDLDLAASHPEIQEVRAALVEAGYLKERRRRPKVGRSQPLKVITPDGFEILVGRNSRQNDEVTFRLGTGHDLWLHVRGLPGAHVIIKTQGREVPERALRQAAELAATTSRGRGSTRVAVDVTLQRNVRRIQGGKPGMVTYTGERTIYVEPKEPEAVH